MTSSDLIVRNLMGRKDGCQAVEAIEIDAPTLGECREIAEAG